MAKIVITAHSGCENTPLNSLESVLKGIEVGSDAVEIDIRSSHDKKPVLSHDPFMIVDGSNHTIGEHTYSSLRK
ncbi:MAG: glycerophosphodiester phosphodiesterase family protein [Sphaerochaetaceae bacterium]